MISERKLNCRTGEWLMGEFPGHDPAGCPVERTLQVIGGKWTLLILRDLFTGTKRFGEIRRSLEHVSPKTLSERLRELETLGLVTRTVYAEVPPRVEYALTEKGESLGTIIEAMRQWGERWRAGS